MTDTKIPQDLLDDLPQPYAQAITLLETIADYGCQPFYEDGSPTQNRALCLEAAGNLRALLRDQRQAVPDGFVVLSAQKLLAIRDALVLKDMDEAYHQLYFLVDWQDPFKPWQEWEPEHRIKED